jgi:hypothetical protein
LTKSWRKGKNGKRKGSPVWVIFVLAGLIVLITILLSVPFNIKFSVNTSEKPKLKVKLAWFFGLISKELNTEKKKPQEKRKVAREKPREKKRKFDFRTILKILQTKGLIKQLKKLIKSTLSQCKIREFVANLKLGFEDPADIGLFFALAGPAMPFINLSSRYKISIQPYLSDETAFEGYLHGTVKFQPVKLVVPILKFVFSLAMFRIVKTFILSRWKK